MMDWTTESEEPLKVGGVGVVEAPGVAPAVVSGFGTGAVPVVMVAPSVEW